MTNCRKDRTSAAVFNPSTKKLAYLKVASNPMLITTASVNAMRACRVLRLRSIHSASRKLLTMEAMKMETTVYAEQAGRVAEVLVKPGGQVEAGDLLVRLEA